MDIAAPVRSARVVAVPDSAVLDTGTRQVVWLLFLMGFNRRLAVAVGFIALAGVAAETGVVMLIYLDHALA